MKTVLVTIGVATLVGFVGVFLDKNGYERGVNAGIEEGRYQQQNYTGVMGMADACYQLGEKYDSLPAAEKIAKGEPVKWDNTTTCDKLRATANHYVGKAAWAPAPSYMGFDHVN